MTQSYDKSIDSRGDQYSLKKSMVSDGGRMPADVMRILREVAKTGACPWLSWGQGHHQLVSESVYSPAGSSSKSIVSVPPSQSVLMNRRVPPRKKQKFSRRKISNKRPSLQVRTNPNSSDTISTIGLGRAPGIELDDSTHYECDSEGTSTTTTSEISNHHQRSHAGISGSHKPGTATFLADDQPLMQSHKSLQDIFRCALGIVLDNFFCRGGYKLSPAEKLRNETHLGNTSVGKKEQVSSEDIFRKRRESLLEMLLPRSSLSSAPGTHSLKQLPQVNGDVPPFTIQRIAEVLMVPERYYTQTHKLCNCLEKLLLVTPSADAFGGGTGGDTSKSRKEERELAALVNERGRQESDLRQKRMKRRSASPPREPLPETKMDRDQRSEDQTFKEELFREKTRSNTSDPSETNSNIDDKDTFSYPELNLRRASVDSSPRDPLEAAARASLRTKFDHGGIYPHLSQDRDVRSINETRGMANSPPPPSLVVSAAPSNISLQSDGGVSGLVRQRAPEQGPYHHASTRVPSPILFPPSEDSAVHTSSNLQSATSMHMLQFHHDASLTDVSLGRSHSPCVDIMPKDERTGCVATRRPAGSTEGSDLDMSSLDYSISRHSVATLGECHFSALMTKEEHGRSSASNSDVDSEQSDDASLDDSASDRSDGSDSGSGAYQEPFTAARAMALNRMQQQQKLQTRVLTSYHNETFRPPADSEYQSGDSIDSMRAEDSGGSDSSSQSSDLAD